MTWPGKFEILWENFSYQERKLQFAILVMLQNKASNLRYYTPSFNASRLSFTWVPSLIQGL